MKKFIVIKSIFTFLLALSVTASAGNKVETKSGLKYQDIKTGDGAEAVFEKVVTVNLALWTDVNGEKGIKHFDSHDAGARAVSFKLGTDKMPDGLNVGINGMRVGGIRRLYVPAELNPKKGSGDFPGNTAMIYEVELLDVK